jgi:hypothetical protein
MGGWVSRLGRASGQRGRWGSGPATLPQRTDAEARLRPSTLSTTRPPRCYHATGAGVRAQGVNAVRMCVSESSIHVAGCADQLSSMCTECSVHSTSCGQRQNQWFASRATAAFLHDALCRPCLTHLRAPGPRVGPIGR